MLNEFRSKDNARRLELAIFHRRLGRPAPRPHPDPRQDPLRPILLDGHPIDFTQQRGRHFRNKDETDRVILQIFSGNEGEADRLILQKFLATHHIWEGLRLNNLL